MQFTTTSQKAYVLEANAAGMNTAKNKQNFFEFRITMKSSKYNKKLIVDDKETTDQTHILESIKEFYETLFKKREQRTKTEIKSFLSHINIPKLSEDKAKLFDDDLTERDLYDSLKSIKNDKSPGNDGLTK